jgi:mannan endo-1,4-beta-mannosidase
VHETLPAEPGSYLGVYEPDAPSAYTEVDRFATTAGHRPNLVLYYNGWGEQFQSSFAAEARARGATVVVDLDPTTVSLSSIADGRQDSYLVGFAREVLRFGHPVVISFGHEMNGNWYSWGWTHASPQLWVQAWRRVVTEFRKVGADNVTWLWTVSGVAVGDGPISDYWPGQAYVTWIGVDAYYYRPVDTFASVFGPTLRQARQLGSEPIVISETAVGPLSGQVQKIPGLFAGVRRRGLLGFVWFDVAQNAGVFKQDWRLENHAAAGATFRREAQNYFMQPSGPGAGPSASPSGSAGPPASPGPSASAGPPA